MHGMAFSECRRGLITNQMVFSFLQHDKQQSLHDKIPLFFVKISKTTRDRNDGVWTTVGLVVEVRSPGHPVFQI
jgi:hypothetical protein